MHLKTLTIFLLLSMISIGTQSAEKKEYVIGLTTNGMRAASMEEVELGFNYELNKLTKDKNYLLKIKVFSNEPQLNQTVLDGKILGYFGSPLLLVNQHKVFNHKLLYAPILNKEVLQRYLLLVRKDSGVTAIAQLKNKALSYCAADEVGMMYVQKLLIETNLHDTESFFNKTVIKKNPNLAITALFFKEVQAAIVLESDFKVATELNPQLNAQLLAIATSQPYVTNVLAITHNLDGPMSEAEYDHYVQNIGSSMRSKRLLKSYHFGNLGKINEEDLITVRELIESVNHSKRMLP